MCLDRVKSRDMSPIRTPEDAPRLFDLITVKDPRLAPAFFQLLTNTLVATDLEQGKRLAFGSGNKRFRVVTLDGQVIDVSGTMSGGGGRPMKGKMGSRIAAEEVSPDMIAKCEQEHQVAGEALKAFVVDRQAIEKDLAVLRKRLPEIETEILKIKMVIDTGSKRRAEANERLVELKSVLVLFTRRLSLILGLILTEVKACQMQMMFVVSLNLKRKSLATRRIWLG